jgi:hypothetical protein
MAASAAFSASCVDALQRAGQTHLHLHGAVRLPLELLGDCLYRLAATLELAR